MIKPSLSHLEKIVAVTVDLLPTDVWYDVKNLMDIFSKNINRKDLFMCLFLRYATNNVNWNFVGRDF